MKQNNRAVWGIFEIFNKLVYVSCHQAVIPVGIRLQLGEAGSFINIDMIAPGRFGIKYCRVGSPEKVEEKIGRQTEGTRSGEGLDSRRAIFSKRDRVRSEGKFACSAAKFRKTL